jgi:hypothetical protein
LIPDRDLGIVESAMALSSRERMILDVERDWWLSAPTKERAIRERLGCSPATFYAALRRLAASREAFEYDPLVVKRLERRLLRRRRARLSGGAALQPPR